MATGTLSLGHDTLARAIAKTEKPAITPWSTRRMRSWPTEVTSPIAATITTKPASERIIIILRPTRSARRPQSGPSSPETAGVTAVSRPDQRATRVGSATPSSMT
jgi:hypothetical protein